MPFIVTIGLFSLTGLLGNQKRQKPLHNGVSWTDFQHSGLHFAPQLNQEVMLLSGFGFQKKPQTAPVTILVWLLFINGYSFLPLPLHLWEVVAVITATLILRCWREMRLLLSNWQGNASACQTFLASQGPFFLPLLPSLVLQKNRPISRNHARSQIPLIKS